MNQFFGSVFCLYNSVCMVDLSVSVLRKCVSELRVKIENVPWLLERCISCDTSAEEKNPGEAKTTSGQTDYSFTLRKRDKMDAATAVGHSLSTKRNAFLILYTCKHYARTIKFPKIFRKTKVSRSFLN